MPISQKNDRNTYKVYPSFHTVGNANVVTLTSAKSIIATSPSLSLDHIAKEKSTLSIAFSRTKDKKFLDKNKEDKDILSYPSQSRSNENSKSIEFLENSDSSRNKSIETQKSNIGFTISVSDTDDLTDVATLYRTRNRYIEEQSGFDIFTITQLQIIENLVDKILPTVKNRLNFLSLFSRFLTLFITFIFNVLSTVWNFVYVVRSGFYWTLEQTTGTINIPNNSNFVSFACASSLHFGLSMENYSGVNKNTSENKDETVKKFRSSFKKVDKLSSCILQQFEDTMAGKLQKIV
ncbi:hypothetical protein HK096_003712 [Nowakowskiella sp. JEL0078]|nr:hypothetical protein HK096_003712 [Nowakowskiella sp. JEL0078]